MKKLGIHENKGLIQSRPPSNGESYTENNIWLQNSQYISTVLQQHSSKHLNHTSVYLAINHIFLAILLSYVNISITGWLLANVLYLIYSLNYIVSSKSQAGSHTVI